MTKATHENPNLTSAPPTGSAWKDPLADPPPQLTVLDVKWGKVVGQAVRCGFQWNQHPKGYICQRPDGWKLPDDKGQR